MDKAKLEARLFGLKKGLEQVQANGNALIGAIKECEYWLSQLEHENGSDLPEAPEARD